MQKSLQFFLIIQKEKKKKLPVHLSCLTAVPIPLNCIHVFSCINQKSEIVLRTLLPLSPYIKSLSPNSINSSLTNIFHILPCLIVSPTQSHGPSSFDCADTPVYSGSLRLLEKATFLSTSLSLQGALTLLLYMSNT